MIKLVVIYTILSEWSRTATQNNRNASFASATTSAPQFTSRSSSVISDATNSSSTFAIHDLHAYTIYTHFSKIILSIFHCVSPQQALCLQTVEYLMAPTVTLSSMSSTDEICQLDNCVER